MTAAEAEQPEGEGGDEPALELRFDHNVIEHLGIKLYQNKPVNVLAELVANCWDADAKHVWIDMREVGGQGMISVADDGLGMDRTTLASRYLVIGKAKRRNAKDKSEGGRLPMGRKGIGKLAPFGVATMVDVATVKGGRLTWFTLSLDGLRASPDIAGRHNYRPEFHVTEGKAALASVAETASPAGPEVRRFIRRMRKIPIDKRSGTLVVMYGLTSNTMPEAPTLAQGLGSRFSVVLLNPGFRVRINRKLIGRAEALPAFDFRIPPGEGFEETDIGGRPIRWWVGFVKTADWPADQAGVGVFAHHKIAQDRPFFFRAKGKEIFQRYMYGVVEADWLDELDKDLVSTDRTSVDWTDDETKDLLEWGRTRVGSWIDRFIEWRADTLQKDVEDTAQAMREERRIPRFSEVENTEIAKLVTDVVADLGKGPLAQKTREELLEAVSKAWINLPTRQMLDQTWRKLAAATDDAERFAGIVETLGYQAVPEAMGLALTFAQRAFALSLLEERINKKSEAKLQILVEEFPWILQPRGELLTADRALKTTIDKLAVETEDDSTNRAGRTIREMSPQERADFVFLTDAEETRIQIVEIKSNDPAHPLNMENERQLGDYIEFVRTSRSTATVSGLLIGWAGAYEAERKSITVKGWDGIMRECRAAYLELLVGALEQADIEDVDDRMEMVKRFGGPGVWKWLERVSQTNEKLAKMMTRVRERLDPPAKAIADATETASLPVPTGESISAIASLPPPTEDPGD